MSRANDIHLMVEAFNMRSVPYKSHTYPNGTALFNYKTRIGGSDYVFHMPLDKTQALSVVFQRDGEDEKLHQGTTQSDVREVIQAMSIVKSMVVDIVKNNEVRSIYLKTSERLGDNRDRLYMRIAQDAARHFNGHVRRHPHGGIEILLPPRTPRMMYYD